VSADGKAGVFDGGADHKGKITAITVSPEGGRVLSSDSAGGATVWRFDGRGKLAKLHAYKSAGSGAALTKAVWVSTRVADGAGGSATLMSFFSGTDGGWLVYGDDQGNCSRVGGDFRSAIDVVEFDPSLRRMVVVTRDLAMAVLSVAADGKVSLLSRAKLSVRASRGITSAAWLGAGVLSTATAEEPAARAWMVGEAEGLGTSFLLKLSDKGRAIPRSDKVSAVAFLPGKSLLAVGTVEGRVLILRRVRSDDAQAPAAGPSSAPSPTRGGAAAGASAPARREDRPKAGADDWTLVRQLDGYGGVTALDWCRSRGVLAVAHEAGASVLQQVPMRRALRWPLAAVQTGVREVVLRAADDPSFRVTVPVPLNVKGLDCTSKTLAAFSARHIAVFDIEGAASAGRAPAMVAKFSFSCRDAVVYGDPRKSGENDTILAAAPLGVVSLNRNGVIKHTLSLAAADGTPICLGRRGRFVAVATDTGAIKVLDASRAEPRVVHEGRFDEAGSGECLGLPTRLAVSVDGTRVAVLSSRPVGGAGAPAAAGQKPNDAGAATAHEPDSRVFVWSSDSGSVSSLECGRGRVPVEVAWDDAEARLLAVQTEAAAVGAAAGGGGPGEDAADEAAAAAAAAASKGLGDAGASAAALSSSGDRESGAAADTEVLTAFITPEGRLLKHDTVPVRPPLESLLGIRVPDVILVGGAGAPAGEEAAGAAPSDSAATAVGTRALRDFVGLEDAEPETKAALLEFSFQLALGNMDAAFAAVRGVDSFSVWRSMALMCVKSRRLDVAAVCLSNMGHVRGVRALRTAVAEPEPEARVAMVAVQLGLLPDAARLYQECGRYDLLNRLFQGCGEWTRALAVADSADRIHRQSTHYRYAAHLESIGDVDGAVRHYEEAGTAKTDVPRMLAVKGRFADLRSYVAGKHDKDLTRWLGQFALSQGQGDLAATLFNEAGAGLDLTRLLCMRKDFASASKLVMATKDVPSAVHLSRQLKMQDKHADAIRHLEAVGRFDHAARVAIDAGMDIEAMTLALRADAPTQRAAAAYFREQGDLGRAVQLLRKGGDLAGALSLCFEVSTARPRPACQCPLAPCAPAPASARLLPPRHRSFQCLQPPPRPTIPAPADAALRRGSSSTTLRPSRTSSRNGRQSRPGTVLPAAPPRPPRPSRRRRSRAARSSSPSTGSTGRPWRCCSTPGSWRRRSTCRRPTRSR